MNNTLNIARFLDENGRITQLPARKGPQVAVLGYLAAKYQDGKCYTEKEVNAICDRWHTFGDYFVLRRGMVDAGLLARTPDGTRYWRAEAQQAGGERQ